MLELTNITLLKSPLASSAVFEVLGADSAEMITGQLYQRHHTVHSTAVLSVYHAICTIVHITRLYTVHIHKGHVLNMFKTSNRIFLVCPHIENKFI